MSTYSFEMYPPRSAAAEILLYETIDRLVETEPEFISVTYGASGSTREASLGVLRHLLTTKVRPMAHLTCVGWTYEDATSVIREFLDVGVTSFLAVRGDPPEGTVEGSDFLGDLKSAGELVQLIHRVQHERAPYSQLDVPGFPHARRISSGEQVTIGVIGRVPPRSVGVSITQYVPCCVFYNCWFVHFKSPVKLGSALPDTAVSDSVMVSPLGKFWFGSTRFRCRHR